MLSIFLRFFSHLSIFSVGIVYFFITIAKADEPVWDFSEDPAQETFAKTIEHKIYRHHPLCAGVPPLSEAQQKQIDAQLAHAFTDAFGQDSLWSRMKKQQDLEKHHFGFRDNNSALSEKMFTLEQGKINLPFQASLALGRNRTITKDTKYVQWVAKKKWALGRKVSLDTNQLIRYGEEIKPYAKTDFNLSQKLNDRLQVMNNMSLIKVQDANYTWTNYTLQKLRFLRDSSATYGIYTSGSYDQGTHTGTLSLLGPYFALRYPLIYNRLYLSNEVLYYHNLVTTNKALEHVMINILKLEISFF